MNLDYIYEVYKNIRKEELTKAVPNRKISVRAKDKRIINLAREHNGPLKDAEELSLEECLPIEQVKKILITLYIEGIIDGKFFLKMCMQAWMQRARCARFFKIILNNGYRK
jgi:hypothetical protein